MTFDHRQYMIFRARPDGGRELAGESSYYETACELADLLRAGYGEHHFVCEGPDDEALYSTAEREMGLAAA